MNNYDTIIIGGGAAGLMAAGAASEYGESVLLIEKNEKLGKKLFITGKGRCNVTNSAPIDEIIKNIPVNGRFMFSALSAFSNEDLICLLKEHGTETKEERGGRIFPVSDKSSDIIKALTKYALKPSVKLICDTATDIIIENDCVCGVLLASGKTVKSNKVIIATGGKSYPQTGSTGDGYTFAKKAGHTIIPPKPSLIPLVTEEKWVSELMGLSLKNVAISITDESGKSVYTDFGEMLFTHYGLSGPIILSASAHLRDIGKKKYKLTIDLKPALDEKTLDKRLLRDFSEQKNKDFLNALDMLLPKKLIPVIIRLSGISPHKKINGITKEERTKLIALLKAMPFTIRTVRPIEEAIITSGGVSTKEINPKTMESKLVSGLYFAGEVIDVDAYTGGFNLQIAFSTGYCAGKNY